MNCMCEADDPGKDQKAGIKVALGTLVRFCCRTLVPFCQAEQKDKFKELFTSHTYYAKIVGKAEYQLKERRRGALPN